MFNPEKDLENPALNETIEYFRIGVLEEKYERIPLGFIPEHLRLRLTFKLAYVGNGNIAKTKNLSTISIYLDDIHIGGFLIDYKIEYDLTIYRAFSTNGMPQRSQAENISSEKVGIPFKCQDGHYHPTFYNLSELLLYHFTKR